MGQNPEQVGNWGKDEEPGIGSSQTPDTLSSSPQSFILIWVSISSVKRNTRDEMILKGLSNSNMYESLTCYLHASLKKL